MEKDFEQIHKLLAEEVLSNLDAKRLSVSESSKLGQLLFTRSIQELDEIVRKIERLGYICSLSWAGENKLEVIF